MRNTLIKIFCAVAFWPMLSLANDTANSQSSVIDPLALYARTVYPEDAQTVGDAARYLLEPSGYTLVTSYPAPSDAITIVNSRIPPIAKIHRTMPIIDALQLLIGNDNWIVIDRNHKLVSFSEKKS
ncbi:hypothetical protein QCD83_23960 [Pseudomonas savastanoi pv. phaseolicola]|uniref:Uncharacterized protein n=1 Tax=Pseudomonas savastanoi pv. glycinea TaxID=318 RepID=A0A3M4MWT5_PSESG|nr:hypothetical protein [Pseudomonas savastanoi]MDG6381888.1 hypothetical protein [Pseudomonas savastanoi pv. phaseolicola]RMM61874.1 hypothetical protein ALQ73_200219 [Pseudomonas savastanoi pv. glycinea]RMQ58159.1 hypothetical protein ALQ01_200075 [Pseudomonas savastanoi pv. glycinea]